MSTFPTGDIGVIVDRGYIEQRVKKHVSEWLPWYLARIAEQKNLASDALPRPKSIQVTDEFARFPENAMPYVAIISPGMNPGKKPRIDSDGDITAYWLVAVGAILTASNMEAAKEAVGYYGAAIRGLMRQMPELQGDEGQEGSVRWCAGVDWEDEKYDDFPRVAERSMSSVRLVFTLEVPDVLNVRNGPRNQDGQFVIPTDIYTEQEDYPDVESPSPKVTIQINPIDGEG